jgi:hypothetical protein
MWISGRGVWSSSAGTVGCPQTVKSQSVSETTVLVRPVGPAPYSWPIRNTKVVPIIVNRRTIYTLASWLCLAAIPYLPRTVAVLTG